MGDVVWVEYNNCLKSRLKPQQNMTEKCNMVSPVCGVHQVMHWYYRSYLFPLMMTLMVTLFFFKSYYHNLCQLSYPNYTRLTLQLLLGLQRFIVADDTISIATSILRLLLTENATTTTTTTPSTAWCSKSPTSPQVSKVYTFLHVWLVHLTNFATGINVINVAWNLETSRGVKIFRNTIFPRIARKSI